MWEQSIDLTDQWCSFMHREPIAGLYLLVVSIVYNNNIIIIMSLFREDYIFS